MQKFWPSVLACFSIFLLLPVSLCGQSMPQKELHLDLAECVQTALANNSQILQGRYTEALAEAQLDNARHSFLPSSTVSWGMSRSISGPREGSFIDPATNLLVTNLGGSRVSAGQNLGTNFGIPVYNAALLSNLASSKIDLKESKMSLNSIRNQVIFQAKQAYFNLLQAKKLLEVQQEQVGVLEESLRRNETLYEIGSTPISDVLSVQANLASAKATLIQRENNVETRRSDLSFTLGLGTDVRIFPTEVEFEVKPLPFTYNEALERTEKQHPLLLEQKYAMLSSRENLKGTRNSIRHPSVSLSARYSWSLGQGESFKGIEDLFLKNYNYNFGVSVNFPIFNMATENSIKIQKIQYFRKLEQFDQAKRQQAQALQQSYLALTQLQRGIEAGEASVKAQEKFFELAQERYNFGAGTFLERLQAQRDLFQERNNLVQAIYNYQIELARLEQNMGSGLFEKIEK